MIGFINSLISRSNGAANIVTPRVNARFESSVTDQVNPVDKYHSDAMQPITPQSAPREELTHPTQGQSSNIRDKIPDHQRSMAEKDSSNYESKNERRSFDNILPYSNVSQVRSSAINESGVFIEPSPFPKQTSAISQSAEAAEQNERSVIGAASAQMISEDLDTPIKFDSRKKKMDRSHDLFIKPVSDPHNSKDKIQINANDAMLGAAANTAPVIRISIGRIDVRAIPSSNGVKTKESAGQKPRLSLEDYLQNRSKKE